MRIQYTLFLSVLVLSGLQAQDHNYRFERLSLESGLSQTTVLSIYQCSKGFMWFGTRHGVNKYDGYKFIVYSYDPNNPHSISNNWITVIFEDSDANIWIGTRDGLNKLDRKSTKGTDFRNEQFIRYNHKPGNRGSLSNSIIHAIYEDATGRLWVGTNQGLNYLDKEKGEFYPYPSQQTTLAKFSGIGITSIIEDEDGELWVGTFDGGLNRISRNRKKVTSYLDGNKSDQPFAPQSISGNTTNTLFRDSSGNIWIATTNGLDCFNKRTGEFKHYLKDDESKSIVDNAVLALTEDSAGAIWIGTPKGLSILDRKTGNITSFKHDPADETSLSTNYVKSLFTDKDGAIWIGTVLGGINRYDPHKNRFKKFSAEPFSENSLSSRLVYSFFETKKGVIWVGTGDGINIFESNQDRFLNVSDYHSDLAEIRGNIFSMCRDHNGEVWVGTNGQGLYRVHESGNGLKRFRCERGDPNSISSNSVWSILEDSAGDLWIGTNGGGLNKYDTKRDSFTRYLHDTNNKGSLSCNWVRTIFEDREGMLWLGTEDGGLNRFDRNSGQFKHYKTISGDSTSLSHNSVTSIYEDSNGFLWVATYGGGINRFDKKLELFTRFTESDGLANNVVYGIVPDEHHRLWLSTNKGLSCFDLNTETFKNYDVDDGLQSNEFNSCAYFKNRNGEMFFGGVNGFNVFLPENIIDKPQGPPILITSVKIFDQVLALETTSLPQIELKYKDDFISFEFVALDFTNSQRNQYAYKLDGFDPNWIYCGGRRYASFTNLEPGEYTFRVKAANSDGVWNETGAAIQLLIHPPFWNTWWFYLLSSTLIAFVVFSFHQYRVKVKVEQIMAVERIRKKAAADFHDELGHKLTKISLFSEMIQRSLNGHSPEISDYVSRINSISNGLYHNMRDFLWTLDPLKDSADAVAIRLKDFGDEFFDKTGVGFQVKGLTKNLENIRLSMDQKRHIILIFKEAMHNCLKHSGCALVHLEFINSNGTLIINLKDDGHGLSAISTSDGNGIKNMTNRAKKIQGSLSIVSEENQGTHVSLECNLISN